MSGILKGSSIYNGNAIYNDGNGGGGGGGGGGLPIPAGYEQLNSYIFFVENRGSNFVIDTSNWAGVTVEVNFKYLAVFENKFSFSVNSSKTFYSVRTDNTIKLTYDLYTYIGGYPGAINLDELAADGTLIKAIFDGPNGKLFWNDEAFILGFPEITNFCVGCNFYGNGSQKMELFSIIIRDSSNTIVFYGTPVKRTLDEVEGILDLLTGTFYTA